jgi:hypothetical protein
MAFALKNELHPAEAVRLDSRRVMTQVAPGPSESLGMAADRHPV